MKNLQLINVSALCMTLLFAIPSSYAQPKIEKKLAEAEITLQQAIDIAEKEVNGRAIEAEIEKNSFGVEYEVEVYASGKEYEISIDAKTSEVLSVREEKD